MDIQKKIGLRIKELRDTAKLSQDSLAHKAGIDRSYITGIETGKRNVSIKNINKIAEALEISLKELFNSEIFDVNTTILK